MRRLRRAATQLVLKPLNAIEHAGRQLAHERATKAVLLDQIAGNVSELSRKILVNKQNVHEPSLRVNRHTNPKRERGRTLPKTRKSVFDEALALAHASRS
jgi:hypothetical protein